MIDWFLSFQLLFKVFSVQLNKPGISEMTGVCSWLDAAEGLPVINLCNSILYTLGQGTLIGRLGLTATFVSELFLFRAPAGADRPLSRSTVSG